MAEDVLTDADADAVLSDVDDVDDPAPIPLSSLSDVDDDYPDPAPPPLSAAPNDSAASDHRVRALLAELDQERRDHEATSAAHSELQTNFNRLKSLTHEIIRKRDETLRENAAAAQSAAQAAAELSEALLLRDEALKQKEEATNDNDSLRSEMETSTRMLVSGIEKISGKVSEFKNFSTGLPQSQKYSGMPAVAYGVIKRANEIAVELTRHVEAANRARDQAREQMEQRNYEIAIEISQLEAAIAGLREEVSEKGARVEGLEKLVAERATKITEMERELSENLLLGEESSAKLRALEAQVEAQRPLILEQLNYISKAHRQINEIIGISDAGVPDQWDTSDSLFMWKEMDLVENLRTSLDGTVSVYELAKVATGKVRERVEERTQEVNALTEEVEKLLSEKHHIGTLLRGALSSKDNEVLEVAENGLKEAGIVLKFNNNFTNGSRGVEVDEVYNLAGAVENTVKASQLEIIELQHLIEALRTESSLQKAHLEAQVKAIAQLTIQIKELEEKEHIANESVEGLMMDIAVAEEEIARWKAAAEQEAAAGRAVEQEFATLLSAARKELDDAKKVMQETENKLKFKEETAAAAMVAKDAAETSLRLADLRSARLRERLEELTRQIEESDNKNDSRTQNSHRYVCWPWEWLGLNFVRYQATEESTTEMELSEPLI